MFSNMGPAASAVSIIFGLIVLVAAALAVARASFAKTQIQALRDDRDDLMTRVQLLESDNVRISESLKVEKDKVKVLESVVTGREQLDHLQATIDTEIRRATEWHKEQRKVATDILKLVGGRREEESVR